MSTRPTRPSGSRTHASWNGRAWSANKERAPLIGLTATPFRGNEAETKTAGRTLRPPPLDHTALGGDDAYPQLQRIGILAQVDHELLPGSDITLSADELKRLETFQRLPEPREQRSQPTSARNRTLLDSIGGLDDDWPVLLFGVSVEHAHTMAALLTRAGISAAAISADTDRGVRRHYIEQFRQGQIRVLANYDVLAAGFDAPRVRAVYIARPTYAPNRYQQMIGRGLRGPRNGGTERCLLVNVAGQRGPVRRAARVPRVRIPVGARFDTTRAQ